MKKVWKRHSHRSRPAAPLPSLQSRRMPHLIWSQTHKVAVRVRTRVIKKHSLAALAHCIHTIALTENPSAVSP